MRPAAPQARDSARINISAAHTVQQHAHGHALPVRLNQCVGEILPGGIIAENIGAHGDAVFGRTDRRQHLRIGFVAALQNRKGIAAGERALRHPRVDPRQQFDMRLRFWFHRLRRVCLFFMQPMQLERAPRHPVDAEQVIDQRAHNWREPDSADPAQRAAHIAFLQQNVDGDDDGQRHMQHGQRHRHGGRRPESGQGKHGRKTRIILILATL